VDILPAGVAVHCGNGVGFHSGVNVGDVIGFNLGLNVGLLTSEFRR
jgi:hypothetical protein